MTTYLCELDGCDRPTALCFSCLRRAHELFEGHCLDCYALLPARCTSGCGSGCPRCGLALHAPSDERVAS